MLNREKKKQKGIGVEEGHTRNLIKMYIPFGIIFGSFNSLLRSFTRWQDTRKKMFMYV